MIGNFFSRRKRLLTILLSIVVFVGYFIVTDPDAGVLQNLHYGVQLALILGIFALAMPVIAFLEVHTDIYTDEIVKDQPKTVNTASQNPTGAGLLLLSKSIALLAYSIVIAAIIISVKDII